jgi:putative Holliday junction resolvase
MPMPRILAIDYGTKRTGLAVTDPNKIIATALDTVHSAKVIEYLKAYLQNEIVECFVVGEPKQMNNTPSEITPHINAFIKKLNAEFPEIPVRRVDERFTSKMAMQSMLVDGSTKADRANKGLIDQRSAVIILQSYLESKSDL